MNRTRLAEIRRDFDTGQVIPGTVKARANYLALLEGLERAWALWEEWERGPTIWTEAKKLGPALTGPPAAPAGADEPETAPEAQQPTQINDRRDAVVMGVGKRKPATGLRTPK